MEHVNRYNMMEIQDRIAAFTGRPNTVMETYPLMDDPKRVVFFSLIYLLMIKIIIPTWMKNRKPFEFRNLMIVYNIFLVIMNSWVVIGLGLNGWFTTYRWRCASYEDSNEPAALRVVYVCWIYHITKLIEYMDTVFFVLRKKDNQVNFLHVFHHSTVPITSWFGVVYGPGGSHTFIILANSFVHVCMYSYYAISALGPRFQKYVWWKKHLTALQLAQFISVMLYHAQLHLLPLKGCKVSPFLTLICGGQAVVYFILFLNFYFQTYTKKIKHSRSHEESTNKNGFSQKKEKKSR